MYLRNFSSIPCTVLEIFCYFYKLINGYHDLPCTLPQHALRNTHSFMQLNAHTDCFHYSFFPHVTSLWNTLPNAVTSAPSIHVFKNLINKLSIIEQHTSSLWAHVYISVLPSLFICPCIWNKFHRKNSRSWGGFGCLLSTRSQPSEFGKITAV